MPEYYETFQIKIDEMTLCGRETVRQKCIYFVFLKNMEEICTHYLCKIRVLSAEIAV